MDFDDVQPEAAPRPRPRRRHIDLYEIRTTVRELLRMAAIAAVAVGVIELDVALWGIRL